MHARPVGRRKAAAVAASIALLLVAWNNVVVTRLPGYPGSYVPGNVAATALLLAVARAEGITFRELGFDPLRLREGLRWGGLTAAGVLFTCLRIRSGSLLAPVLLHAATNCLGMLAAVAAHRLGRAHRARPG